MGGVGRPLTETVGIQYAAVSPLRVQVVVPALRSEAGVEDALVVVLPTKLWSCETPGWPG